MVDLLAYPRTARHEAGIHPCWDTSPFLVTFLHLGQSVISSSLISMFLGGGRKLEETYGNEARTIAVT